MKKPPMMKLPFIAWTDYPIEALGDKNGVVAPIRSLTVHDYDGDKYAEVLIAGMTDSIEIKASYIYIRRGRLGDVLNIVKAGWIK